MVVVPVVFMGRSTFGWTPMLFVRGLMWGFMCSRRSGMAFRPRRLGGPWGLARPRGLRAFQHIAVIRRRPMLGRRMLVLVLRLGPSQVELSIIGAIGAFCHARSLAVLGPWRWTSARRRAGRSSMANVTVRPLFAL